MLNFLRRRRKKSAAESDAEWVPANLRLILSNVTDDARKKIDRDDKVIDHDEWFDAALSVAEDKYKKDIEDPTNIWAAFRIALRERLRFARRDTRPGKRTKDRLVRENEAGQSVLPGCEEFLTAIFPLPHKQSKLGKDLTITDAVMSLGLQISRVAEAQSQVNFLSAAISFMEENEAEEHETIGDILKRVG